VLSLTVLTIEQLQHLGLRGYSGIEYVYPVLKRCEGISPLKWGPMSSAMSPVAFDDIIESP
jgi:hypothetical protein